MVRAEPNLGAAYVSVVVLLDINIDRLSQLIHRRTSNLVGAGIKPSQSLGAGESRFVGCVLGHDRYQQTSGTRRSLMTLFVPPITYGPERSVALSVLAGQSVDVSNASRSRPSVALHAMLALVGSAAPASHSGSFGSPPWRCWS
jgi:hypothetical protein